MSNSFKIAFVATVLYSSSAFALNPFSCPKGQKMAGSVTGNAVFCVKPEKKRGTPKCGVRRYHMDRVKNVDKCVRARRPHKIKGDPRCLFPRSVRKVLPKYDICVTPGKKGKVRYCKSGWTMDGSITALGGRGSIHCQTFGKKKKTPKCGVKRYALNRQGKADRCVDPNNPTRIVGAPKCAPIIGGKLKVLPGYDWCFGGDKVRKPWKK